MALGTAVPLMLSLLPSCGSDSDPTPDAAPSVTTSATPTEPAATPAEASSTEDPPTTDLPPRPRATDDPAGRKRFTRFVIDSWGHTLATSDAEAITRLSPRGGRCQGCRPLVAEMRKRAKEGWRVDFTGVTIHDITLRPGQSPGVWEATARISVPETRSYFEDGSYRNDNPAHRNARFDVTMRLDGQRYSLLAFSLR